MGLKGRNNKRQYLDLVELFASINGEDKGGFPTETIESIGVYPANVDEMSGGRALYFKSQGYTNPLTIQMYRPDKAFTTIVWNNVQCAVRSITEDKNNNDCLVIYADKKTNNPN